MSIEINNKFGTIVVNLDIIAEIAEKATSECYGVIGLKAPSAKGVTSLLKRESNRGVVITEEEEGLVVGIFVVIQYGVNMGVVAENIMDHVKYHLEAQLGVRVHQVNITIDDVNQGV